MVALLGGGVRDRGRVGRKTEAQYWFAIAHTELERGEALGQAASVRRRLEGG